MNYICIKELIKDGRLIMSEGDSVRMDDTGFYNNTTNTKNSNITYQDLRGCIACADVKVGLTCDCCTTTDFERITKGMFEIYKKKNHDYGNSFDQSLDKFGLIASVVRLGDKMNRIESLVNKEAQVKDESIRDTILDMANYCIMTAMWMDANQTRNA